MSRWRCWCLVLGLSIGAASTGCTSKNPAATCAQGTCIDPNFPYCDLDGSIGGEAGTCIAVTCTAGEFGKCSGDTALTCNQFGTGYDQVSCAHGCDDSQGGCRLCEPNQTACTDGTVATCDSNGNQTVTQECPLGCFEDQPRCRDIDPSNRLSTYLDMTPSPTDLVLDQVTVDTDSGMIVDSHGAPITATAYLAAQPAGGSAIRVYIANKLTLGDVTVHGQNAIAFVAANDVEVTGVVSVGGAGSLHGAMCTAQGGTLGYTQANDSCFFLPPGGGASATAGTNGGRVIDFENIPARVGGQAVGTDDLQPLAGGCVGGGFNNSEAPANHSEGASGGGAIQISSRTAISIVGTINASGGRGYWEEEGNQTLCGGLSPLGGGGGGSILLEAPQLTVSATGVLDASGADGSGCDPQQQTCAFPGRGAHGNMAGTNGSDVTFVTAFGDKAYIPGTGAGGVGRVRINTRTGSYSADSASIIDALKTTSMLKTR